MTDTPGPGQQAAAPDSAAVSWSAVFDAVQHRMNVSFHGGACPACGQGGNHYVPSVGHLTPPEDAITPYYSCTREKVQVVTIPRLYNQAGSGQQERRGYNPADPWATRLRPPVGGCPAANTAAAVCRG